MDRPRRIHPTADPRFPTQPPNGLRQPPGAIHVPNEPRSPPVGWTCCWEAAHGGTKPPTLTQRRQQNPADGSRRKPAPLPTPAPLLPHPAPNGQRQPPGVVNFAYAAELIPGRLHGLLGSGPRKQRKPRPDQRRQENQRRWNAFPPPPQTSRPTVGFSRVAERSGATSAATRC